MSFCSCWAILFRSARIRISLAALPKKVLLALYFPLSFLFCYLILFVNHLEQSAYSAAILAAIILTNLPVAYYLFVSVIRTYEEQRRLDDALAQTQAQLSRYRFSLELEDRLSKERHELKNRYFYIQTLLKEKKYDKLDGYLNDVLGTQLSSKQNIHTGNTLMDYIINRKLQEAQKNHIVTCSEILVPSQLPLSDDTLCTILLNLLDNAIEASLLCTGSSYPDYCKMYPELSVDPDQQQGKREYPEKESFTPHYLKRMLRHTDWESGSSKIPWPDATESMTWEWMGIISFLQ